MLQMTNDRQAKKPQEQIKRGFCVGDILVAQVGCTMTLYEFYQIVGMTDTQAIIRKLKTKTVGGDSFRPIIEPIRDDFDGEEERKKVTKVKSLGFIKDYCVAVGSCKHLAFYWSGVQLEEDHLD